jgi:MscS family membrane protein
MMPHCFFHLAHAVLRLTSVQTASTPQAPVVGPPAPGAGAVGETATNVAPAFTLPDWLLPDVLRGQLEHPWMLAAAVVVASLIAAKIADWLVTGLVKFVVKRTRTELDDELIGNLHGPVVKTVILIGLWIACRVLEGESQPVLWAHRSIVTLVVIVWTAGVVRTMGMVLRVMARHSSRFHAVDSRTLPLFSNLSILLVMAFALYMVIEVWGLNPTGWLASAGVAGIALGFAAKDTLANLFAGVFIIADAPYRVGDYVNLDSGHRGRVQHIGLRSTRMLTRDDVEITIPNSIIGGGAIVNESSGAPRYRLRVKVGVAYGTDIDQVRDVLLEVAAAVDMTLDDPEPRVRLRRFGDNALEFELLAWIREPEKRGHTLDALHRNVYTRFAAEKIEIAFPQQDLHVRTVPGGWLPAGESGAAGSSGDS